jgi:hypothetical protein
MECRPKMGIKMKTRNIITAIGVAAMAATAINLSAGEALLSPRARDNQIKSAPAAASEWNLATENRNFLGSPRALDNVVKTLPATRNDVNLATLGRDVIASPRGADTFPKTAVAGACCVAAKSCCTAKLACCSKH